MGNQTDKWIYRQTKCELKRLKLTESNKKESKTIYLHNNRDLKLIKTMQKSKIHSSVFYKFSFLKNFKDYVKPTQCLHILLRCYKISKFHNQAPRSIKYSNG
jgi:hypothetical protein